MKKTSLSPEEKEKNSAAAKGRWELAKAASQEADPDAERISNAYDDAQRSADQAVQKARLCGQLLLEKRAKMSLF